MGTPTLAEVIGQNVRRIRQLHNLTLESVADATVKRGLKWTNTRVASMEAGAIPPNLNTLIPLALALSDCTGQPLELKDLFETEVAVRINQNLALPPKALASWISGGSVELAIDQVIGRIQLNINGSVETVGLDLEDVPGYESVDPQALRNALREQGIAEQRVCSSLGISPISLAISSLKLWGRPFAEERDRRAPKGSSPQARGRVSRALKTELRAELADGNSQ